MESLEAFFLAYLSPHLPEAFGEFVADFLVRIVVAVFYLLIGLWFASWLCNVIAKLLSKIHKWDQTLTPTLSRVVWVLVLLITLFTILTTFGVHTTAILAVLSGAALTIGLAVQGTLSNVASGIMLLVIRPMRNDHYVFAGSAEGYVVEINLFRTTIRTRSGALVSMPNSSVFGEKIINYSSASVRSLWVEIGIAYDADIDIARNTIEEILNADERWLSDPQPKVYVSELGDFAVTLAASACCPTKVYFQAKSDFLEAIKKEFKKRGINIPFPTRTIHMIPATPE